MPDNTVGSNGASPKHVAPRRLIFISHAAPEDNSFAKWLATQLAIAGYEVWCDVTKLLGGEKFWKDITDAIDHYAFRVLFVSTLEANRKAGALRELRLAFEAQQNHALKDFVVPLKIDEFPFESMQQEVRDLNCVRFDGNWASGLSRLIELLEREGAPKSLMAGPDCVASWYRRSIDRQREIVVSKEKYLSNWFQIRLPKRLRFHRFRGSSNQLERVAVSFPHPYRVHGQHLVTFAAPHEVRQNLGDGWDDRRSQNLVTARFVDKGHKTLGIAPFDASNIVSDLVRQAWESEMRRRDLSAYELASGIRAWFFAAGQLDQNRAYFKAEGGRRTYRQMVGKKSKRTSDGHKISDGYWHYAVSASEQLKPLSRLVLRHHVVFTDDGTKPWANAGRMHKARRKVCRNWWNREWRDRLLAFCAQLSGGQEEIHLALSESEAIVMSSVPMSFNSPWTDFGDAEFGLDETKEIELIEDHDAEDDDEDEE